MGQSVMVFREPRHSPETPKKTARLLEKHEGRTIETEETPLPEGTKKTGSCASE